MTTASALPGLATARTLRGLRVPDDAIRRALVAEVGLTDEEIVAVLEALDAGVEPEIGFVEASPAPRLLFLPRTCRGCPGIMACHCRQVIHLPA